MMNTDAESKDENRQRQIYQRQFTSVDAAVLACFIDLLGQTISSLDSPDIFLGDLRTLSESPDRLHPSLTPPQLLELEMYVASVQVSADRQQRNGERPKALSRTSTWLRKIRSFLNVNRP